MIVYKIVLEKEWQDACQTGVFYGSETDRRDGFIHLSTYEQVEKTAGCFFKKQEGLLLVAFKAKALGTHLRFEPSTHGDMYPHFYSNIPTNLALWKKQMFLGEDLIPRVIMDA